MKRDIPHTSSSATHGKEHGSFGLSRRQAGRTIVGLGVAAMGMPAFLRDALADATDGALIVSPDSNLNTLDPVKMTIGAEYSYALNVFDGLVYIDRSMTVQPELAKSWDVSDDLKTWTFHLQEGVKFHNGQALTADDVVGTFQRILDPANGSRMRANLSIVDKIEAVDPHTVKFELNIPYSDLAAILGDYQARITPKGLSAQLATQPVGTGPFKFVEFLPNDHLSLDQNPDYWQQGMPKVKSVQFKIIPEYATKIAALENGELQIVHDLPPEDMDQLAKSQDAHSDEVPSGTWYAYGMRNDMPPFNDVRVRQAIFKLIDRQKIADIATVGHGTATLTPIPPTHPAYDKAFPIPVPDVEGAKKLLAEAGYPNGLDLVLWTPRSPVFERFAVALRDGAKAGGVNVEVRPVPEDQFFDQVEGKQPFFTDNFFGRATPDTMLYPWFHSTGSWNKNTWRFNDPEVDKLLDQARVEKSTDVRNGIYKKLQEILVERGPCAVVFLINFADGVSKSVTDYHSSPRQWMNFRNVQFKS
jgi:peptide/nickel transport system substrate-binding protein